MDNNSPIPMLDLKAQYLALKPELDEAVMRVIESTHFINGPDVEAMEQEVAQYCRAGHCIGVSSGSDALLVCLMALDIGQGDEVITTPYTFFATAGAIVRMGARPVFCDIDPVTFNIDPAQIAAKVTKRTRAIMPVHLFGQCAEMDPILEIASKHKLAVIEDAAQAIGSEYKGRRAGSMGTVGCYSFFPSKNLGCFGDGGAVVTQDRALADKIRLLRGHGSHPKYFHKLVGGNFRLDSIHAAVLRVKLKHLDSWTQARQQGAAYYTACLMKYGLGRLIEAPKILQSRHIFNQYVVRCDDREGVREHLKKEKITTEVYYPQPMHLQECFANLGYKKGEFPESELAAVTSLALPMYPELPNAQRERVVRGIVTHFEAAGKLSRRATA
ncbi:MAG: DegT/DnrJ/EryC1/StrS family aminotransferase [Planctomycetes bacterium]|nr:DegT/DnrJ/EryC1/StrS family aminotransferase [Planctomycetota bacterium]